MLKGERHLRILEHVNKSGVVTVTELIKDLKVSDMTIRRDLEELGNLGKLIRIHGGAQSINESSLYEPTRMEKQELHVSEKEAVAKEAANNVEDGDTIYIGPGTTLEYIAKYVSTSQLRVVTNSLPVFEKFKTIHPECELILVGGTYRDKSGAFIGSLTNQSLSNLKFNKAFVGINGINKNQLMTANPEEGRSHIIALQNATKTFVVTDMYKLNKDDFYTFYDLKDIDNLITNEEADKDILKSYTSVTNTILAK